MKPTTLRIDKCPRCGCTLRERDTVKNAHLHAILGAISKQKKWAGQYLDIEAWKRLIVASYERAHGRPAEVYQAIDGDGLDVVYRRTSLMSQAEIRELILYAESWAIDNGVDIVPPERAAA
ncbi:MAG TPA: recombination protein NinB [Kofleriaceae bacterium]